MKNLKHKESGEQIQVHDVDARELVNSGVYEDLGSVPIFNPSRAMTVAELAGVKARAESVAVKVIVADLPEFKAAVETASARIAKLEAEVASRNALMAEGNKLIDEQRAEIADINARLEAATKPSSDKAALVARAAELKIAAPSVLERWGETKLSDAIAEAEKA